jgi:precorrin-6B methylase 2
VRRGFQPQGGTTVPDEVLARGVKLLRRGAPGDAVKLFERAVAGAPDHAEARALLGETYLRLGRLDEAEAAMRAAIALCPAEPDLHVSLARLIAQRGRTVEAIGWYRRAAALDPRHRSAAELIEAKSQVTTSIHAWHLPMLADVARNDAFQAAIEAAVRQDDIVLDIGTGSGLLAMMAARAGAAHVFACERERNLADLARLVVAENGLESRVTIIAKDSREMVVGRDLPARATLLVTEIFDSLLIGEGALTSIRHARDTLLALGARVIPRAGSIRGQLGSLPRLKHLHPLRGLNGFSLRALADHALEKQFYPVFLPLEEGWTPLTEPLDILRVDFEAPFETKGEWSVTAPVERPGRLQALVLWLELDLGGAVLSAGPGGGCHHWNQVAYLLDAECDLHDGDSVLVGCRMDEQVMQFSARKA